MTKTNQRAHSILIIILAGLAFWILINVINYGVECDIKKKIDQVKLIERDIDHITATAKKLKEVQEELQKQKKEAAVSEILTAVISYYKAYGVHDKDRQHIKRIIFITANAVREAYETGYFKAYAKDKTEALQQLLSEIPIESNFTEYLICINYDKITKKEKSRDYGLWQVNTVNIESALKILSNLKLWSPASGRWTMDARTNCLMRLVVNEDRTIRGWDRPGAGNWNNNFLSLLKHIKDWDLLFQAAQEAPGSN